MLYELLAGTRPFDGETESQTLANVILCRYAPLAERAPWVPADVQEVVGRLLAATPEGRFATAHEALRALVACRCYVPDGTSEVGALVERVLGPPPPPVPSDAYVAEVRGSSDATRTRTPSGGARPWVAWLGGAVALAAGVVVAVWIAPRMVERAPVPAAVVPPPAAPVVVAPVDAAPPSPDAAPAPPDAAVPPAPKPRSSRRARPEWEIPTDRRSRDAIVR
jgi:serine/threonine-protein kinase